MSKQKKLIEEKIDVKLIEEEMKENYMDYAMSVIVSRALPDVRDGLKPVHRRVLYTMNQLNLVPSKPFRKSATVVGNVMSKYHPHGDAAIYDTLVRLAQPFSLRYPLVNGQGNFGSVDGDSAAAMRYTEAKLQKISLKLMEDIEKDTVDFVPNFDNTAQEPVVLPSVIPNLLINGSSGIAVGMATNIPPHNLNEVVDGIIYFIDNPNCSVKELMKLVKGPDFPTGGIIVGNNGIKQAYDKGKGRVILRAKTSIEKEGIIINEIPYQLNKASLIEAIANLVKEKKIEGISDIRDESDRRGIRVVIKVKQNANPEIVLNQLFKHTQLEQTYSILLLAIVKGEPKILSLKEIMENYVSHRKEVITRRSKFDLEKSKKRVHILEGFKKALSNIDAIVKTIKSSKDVKTASEALQKKFKLSKEQAGAILEMKLQRLTSMERDKIDNEHKELLKFIKELEGILSSNKKVLSIIKKDLNDLKDKFGDERRTKIRVSEKEDVDVEELIHKQDIVITLTYSGYIKQSPLSSYRQQKRRGKGIIATGTKEGDFVKNIFVTSNKSYLLFFTNKGRIYWLKSYELPEGQRYSRGKALVNLLKLGKEEFVNALLPLSDLKNKGCLVFMTKNGVIKKTKVSEFSHPRKGGIIAINLKGDDEVVDVKLVGEGDNLLIATKDGMAVKIRSKDIRAIGRNAAGVRGIRLRDGDYVVGMEVSKDEDSILTATEKGYGKRTILKDYREVNRGGVGVINIKCTDKNGKVVGVKTVSDEDEIMIVTKKGVTIRISASQVSKIGRNTQGVRMIKLKDGDSIAKITKVVKED